MPGLIGTWAPPDDLDPVDDPVEGMHPDVRLVPRDLSEPGWLADRLRPPQRNDQWNADWHGFDYPVYSQPTPPLWAALITNLGDTFSDVLSIPVIRYPENGYRTGRKGRKLGTFRSFTAADIRRMLLRRYTDRFRLAKRLFGAILVEQLPALPAVVWEAATFAERSFLSSRITREVVTGKPAMNRFVAEAAHYAYRNGPAGLATLRTVVDLDPKDGLSTLLATWWRMPC